MSEMAMLYDREPELTAEEVVQQWLTEGKRLKVHNAGLQGGLFGGEDLMVDVTVGAKTVTIPERVLATLQKAANDDRRAAGKSQVGWQPQLL